MNGIYWLLFSLPLGATTFALYALTLGMIFILRDMKEGLFYNTSYSAMIGDGALLAVVVSAIGILKQGGVPPVWFTAQLQMGAFGMSIVVGMIWFLRDRPRCPADRYHHLVIAPLLLFLLLTLVPVIIKNGTRWDNALMVCFVAVWVGTLGYDVVTNRLDQRHYHNLGFHLNAFFETFKK
jgi:hypothetical protein